VLQHGKYTKDVPGSQIKSHLLSWVVMNKAGL